MHLNVSKIRRKKKKIRKLTEVENKKNFEIKSTDAIKNKKIKTNIDFSKNEYNSIKSIAIKGNTTIEVTSRFIKKKHDNVFKSSNKIVCVWFNWHLLFSRWGWYIVKIQI